MILISHRGNINGKNPSMENHPDYIKKSLKILLIVVFNIISKIYSFYYILNSTLSAHPRSLDKPQ